MNIQTMYTKKSNLLISQLLDLLYANTIKYTYHQEIPIWYQKIYYKNPVNLLFSNDQFLYEFLNKYPRRKKTSEYKVQLKEQKKLSLFYGYISKKQLNAYFAKSRIFPGESSKQFISLLEHRLDVILYRSQFTQTIATARQLILYRKITVNNKIVCIPSYLVQPGDIIGIVPNVHKAIEKRLQRRYSVNTTRYKEKRSILPIMNMVNRSSSLSKNQFYIFIALLMKKMHSRAYMVQYANCFLSTNPSRRFEKQRTRKDSREYSCINTYISRKSISNQTDVKSFNDYLRNLVLKYISMQNFDSLSKNIFYQNVNKYMKKTNPKSTMLDILNIFTLKPLHLEISYKIFSIIFLYSPQRVYYPFSIHFDILQRALNN